MAILWCGGVATDFAGTTLVDDAGATGRDAAYSPTAIYLNVATANQTAKTFLRAIPAFTGDFWAHFRWLTPPNTTNASVAKRLFSMWDANGNLLAAAEAITGTAPFLMRVFGDTTVSGAGWTLSPSSTLTIDIKLTVNATSISADLYVDGTLVSSATAANTVGLKGAPTRFQWDMNGITTQANASFKDTWLSEFIFASDEDTRGLRLATLRPTATGTWTDWTGGLAQISDSDLATAATAGSPW